MNVTMAQALDVVYEVLNSASLYTTANLVHGIQQELQKNDDDIYEHVVGHEAISRSDVMPSERGLRYAKAARAAFLQDEKRYPKWEDIAQRDKDAWVRVALTLYDLQKGGD